MTIIKKLHFRGFKSFAKPLDLEFGTGFNAIIGPNGSGKSLDYNSQVLLADGSKRKIGELVDEYLNKSKSHIALDDGVYTYDNPDNLYILALNKTTMQIEKCPIQAFIKREGEPYLYKITTQSGKSAITTGCHPVMTFKNGKVCSEVVEHLTTDNVIATPRSLQIEAKKQVKFEDKAINKDFARMLGYLIGDGYIKQEYLELINSNQNIIQNFRNIYEKVFSFNNFKTYKKQNSYKSL